MTAINKALQNITLGDVQAFENLSVTPLLASAAMMADYLTLDEAQAQGLASVTEVSESGSVPTLLLENAADMALFLLDGEELLGAKQNRIINLTLLVPAKSRLEIPVSCVERGRWNHRTAEFSSADRTLFSRGRARKAARVSENMRSRASRHSDQGEVWGDISAKMGSLCVASATDAMSDVYDHFAKPIDDYVGAFEVAETQVGACFAINGVIRGLELFDTSDACGKLMPKLVRSYALDALDERQADAGRGETNVETFLQNVCTAPVDSFEALGEGEDLRIRSTYIAGGALAARDRVIHLCAFPHESDVETVDPFRGAISRASSRHWTFTRRASTRRRESGGENQH